MTDIINKLKKLYNVSDEDIKNEKQVFITVSKDDLPSMITHLRDYGNYTHFVFLTAVDRIEDNQFQLTYMLHNYLDNSDLGIRVMLDRDNPEMISTHHLWKQIATYQRELYEMFGISFPGSPDLKEPFILEGWHEMPPMRRDFDTKEYSEKTYFPRKGRKTHDPKEYMKQKLYPDKKRKEK